jgi:oligopeptide transport system substrate-binding protein
MLKVLAVFMVLLAAALGAALLEGPRPRADLVIVNNGDVSTLDPAQMSWVQDFRAARLLYEGLTSNDVMRWSFPTVPAAATEWNISPDGLTYTFTLSPSGRWSDGSSVTSHDFEFAWMRMLLPDHGADYVKLLRLIQGGDEFYAWRLAKIREFVSGGPSGTRNRAAAAQQLWDETLIQFETLVRIETPDPLTLVVTLKKPVPYFISLTAFPPFFPLCKAAVQPFQSLDPVTGQLRTDPAWSRPPNLLSNGPFYMTSWRFKRELRVEKNNYYRDADNITLRSISMPTIDDGNAAVLSFRTNTVDWVSDVVPSYRADMLAAKRAYYDEHKSEYDRLVASGLDPIEIDRNLPPDPRKNIHAFPSFGTYFYNFNCRKTLADGRPNPFADPRVRRAFSMSIDRRGVVDTVRRSGERPARALIPPGSIHQYASEEGAQGIEYDPAAALALLKEAGYNTGADFPTVELLFNKEGGHDLIAQYIAKGWQQALGVSVSLAQKEVKVFREQVKSGNFMVSRGTWFGDYGDPTTFLDIHRDGDGNNDRAFVHPDFESLMDAAASEVNTTNRMEVLLKAEELLTLQEVPVAPIFHFVQVYLFDPHRISGISPHPRQEQNLYRLRRLDLGQSPIPMGN